MTYKDLTVTDGTEAQVVWNQMIQLSSSAEKEILAKQLKDYCRRDSLGMVEILRALEKENI